MKENQTFHQDNLGHLTGFYHGRYYDHGVAQISWDNREKIEQKHLPKLHEYIVYQGEPGQIVRAVSQSFYK